MKFEFNALSPIERAIVLQDFLGEIERVLPAITDTLRRAIIVQIQSLFEALLYKSIMGDQVPPFSVSDGVFQKLVETLRCCGIAPVGWPVPPGPGALLRARSAYVSGWGETDGQGGGTP